MATDPFTEGPEPRRDGSGDDGRDEAVLQAQAGIAIERWLLEVPGAAEVTEAAARARTRATRLARSAQRAQQADQDASRRLAELVAARDPAGQRTLGFGDALGIVVLLLVFAAIPLSWAAQAFGLGSPGTWAVTVVLVAASAGAMFGLAATSTRPWWQGLLAAVAGTAYLVLAGLRAEFLITVAADPLPSALLESLFLAALSVVLVLCGAVVLSRTQSPGLSRAWAAARRARLAAVAARDAHGAAVREYLRHVAAMRKMLLPWALTTAAPAHVDRASWAAALERAMRQLLPPP